jgi:RNA-binding protein NOB1
MPKGGKHSNNPILCEDQREAQQRTSKAAKVHYNVFDPDYVAFNSPFAPIDTYSRAAQLGINGRHGHRGRRNPNEPRKHGRKK